MSTKLQKDDLSIAILSGGKSSRMDYEGQRFNQIQWLFSIIENTQYCL